MSVRFEIPEWLMPAAPPPPDTSTVDPHRIEGLVNRFIAAKQDALFIAPDAYYRQTGSDAVSGVSGVFDRLNALRDTTLDAAEKFNAEGRTYYWHGPSETLVIRDPLERHGGSAFKPSAGKPYFDNLRARFARSNR
jgi:hypothetical protein